MKKMLGITGNEYDTFILSNIWAYETILNLYKEGLLISYPELDVSVDTKAYLEMLAKVVLKSGAYKELADREESVCSTVAYPEIESSSDAYEFIMLAYGNAFGDEGREQGKKMYEEFYLGKDSWLDKKVTRYEMMSLAVALFDFSETTEVIDVTNVPERFVSYVKQAIQSGWYKPYQQDGKTVTITNLYLSEESNIFNAYALMETVYKTLKADSILYDGYLKNVCVVCSMSEKADIIEKKPTFRNLVENKYVWTSGKDKRLEFISVSADTVEFLFTFNTKYTEATFNGTANFISEEQMTHRHGDELLTMTFDIEKKQLEVISDNSNSMMQNLLGIYEIK